jgi:pimeloyl-ACP methyl ester carboxylesterase
MKLQANGLAIEAQVDGPSDGVPLLLIMGLGMQLTAWPQPFIEQLVARGFRVIRFDNRDAGLSQGFEAHGVPNLAFSVVRHALHLRVRTVYTLDDMAADAFGVLDALGIEAAHVCGVSMGGMVAQCMATAQPRRVKSLSLMMTSSGARHLPQPSLRVRQALLRRPPKNASSAQRVEHLREFLALIGSPGYPTDAATLRERIAASVRRAYRPDGVMRQLNALVAHGDRSPRLRAIAAPTLVIHGRADPLIPAAAAQDLVGKIRGAGLEMVDGMGHDLPHALLGRFAESLGRLAKRSAALL